MKKILLLILIPAIFFPVLTLANDYYALDCVRNDALPELNCAGELGNYVCITNNVECQAGDCSFMCPSPTLEHSHYVQNECVADGNWYCTCEENSCGGTASCIINGICRYECDEGYILHEGICEEISLKYTCSVEYQCIEDSEGEFGTLEACENVCVAPPPPQGGNSVFTLPGEALANTTAYIDSFISDTGVFIWLAIGVPLGFYVIKKVIVLLPKK